VKTLETTFGTEGAEWNWQNGGTVKLPAGKVPFALRDLTGFDGRCDAIVLTTATGFVPPNDDPEMAGWRRRLLGLPETPKNAGQFDLVSDAGLERLENMKGLRMLSLSGSQVTDEGIEKLKQALPNCRILN